MNEANIEKIRVGDLASITKLMNESDVLIFSEISEDYNPVHLDKEYAENSRFRRQIVHGLMPASLFSGLFGTKLPGIGCVFKSLNLEFKRAIYIGDNVEARVEVKSVNKEKKVIEFRTVCLVKGKVMIDGEAEIFIP